MGLRSSVHHRGRARLFSKPFQVEVLLSFNLEQCKREDPGNVYPVSRPAFPPFFKLLSKASRRLPQAMCCALSFPLSPLSCPHHYLRTYRACEEDNSKFITSIESILRTPAYCQGRVCACSSRHTPETVLPALCSAFPVRALKTTVGYSFAQALMFSLKLGAQIPCCFTGFPRCWAETKGKTAIFQRQQLPPQLVVL